MMKGQNWVQKITLATHAYSHSYKIIVTQTSDNGNEAEKICEGIVNLNLTTM